MQRCPFCGEPESERFAIEKRLYLVFPCMFTARVAPGISEDQIAKELETHYGGQGGPFFRRTCDVLHLYVTQGAGATVLTSDREPLNSPAGPAGPLRAAAGPRRGDAATP